VRRVIESVVRHCEIPRPKAASRICVGTSSSISSVVRVMVGIIMMAERHTAGKRGKMLLPNYDDGIGHNAMTIDGTPLSTSE